MYCLVFGPSIWYIKTRILETMFSGIPLVLGLGTRMAIPVLPLKESDNKSPFGVNIKALGLRKLPGLVAQPQPLQATSQS